MAKRRNDDDDFDDDDDDDDEDDDDPESFNAVDWLTGEPFDLPDTWEDWIEFDWDSYDGDYEEFAVSADYE
jgi:hypothetical protein